MKFLRELSEQVEPVIQVLEEGDNGKKNFFIEGIFMQGDIVNKNGRRYPVPVLEKECARYTAQKINQNRAYGELGHPNGPKINEDRISHRIVELKRDGNNFIGKALVSETPHGKIVKTLMNEGGSLGISSRGMGTLKPVGGNVNEVQGDFFLATGGDIVVDPSAPEAILSSVMENTEWWLDEATGEWYCEHVENMKKQLHSMPVKQIQEQKLYYFSKFVEGLVKK